MPAFSFVLLIAALSSMGMPPLNGFVGELTILQGALLANFWWALACVAGIALGAAYLIWLFQRTALGETSEKNAALPDLTRVEWAVTAPLVAAILAIGLWPQPWFDVMERSTAAIVERVNPGSMASR
jgi:NADH-quinone oxidoreductase subunit M